MNVHLQAVFILCLVVKVLLQDELAVLLRIIFCDGEHAFAVGRLVKRTPNVVNVLVYDVKYGKTFVKYCILLDIHTAILNHFQP